MRQLESKRDCLENLGTRIIGKSSGHQTHLQSRLGVLRDQLDVTKVSCSWDLFIQSLPFSKKIFLKCLIFILIFFCSIVFYLAKVNAPQWRRIVNNLPGSFTKSILGFRDWTESWQAVILLGKHLMFLSHNTKQQWMVSKNSLNMVIISGLCFVKL